MLKYLSGVRGAAPYSEQAVAGTLLRLFAAVISRNLVLDKVTLPNPTLT